MSERAPLQDDFQLSGDGLHRHGVIGVYVQDEHSRFYVRAGELVRMSYRDTNGRLSIEYNRGSQYKFLSVLKPTIVIFYDDGALTKVDDKSVSQLDLKPVLEPGEDLRRWPLHGFKNPRAWQKKWRLDSGNNGRPNWNEDNWNLSKLREIEAPLNPPDPN